MQPSDILSRAADRLEQPGAWTQNAFARTSDDKRVFPYSSNAVCWCARGVVAKELQHSDEWETPHAYDYLRRAAGALSIATWNDAPERTQAEVVAALRKAAEMARSEGR